MRILVCIRWKNFHKHLSLPFCPSALILFFCSDVSGIQKCQSNPVGSHTRSVNRRSLLRYILDVTLTPATARILALVEIRQSLAAKCSFGRSQFATRSTLKQTMDGNGSDTAQSRLYLSLAALCQSNAIQNRNRMRTCSLRPC